MLGVAELDGLPPRLLSEIAFAGRSNVGKSSLINALRGVMDLGTNIQHPRTDAGTKLF